MWRVSNTIPRSIFFIANYVKIFNDFIHTEPVVRYATTLIQFNAQSTSFTEFLLFLLNNLEKPLQALIRIAIVTKHL